MPRSEDEKEESEREEESKREEYKEVKRHREETGMCACARCAVLLKNKYSHHSIDNYDIREGKGNCHISYIDVSLNCTRYTEQV